MPLFGWLLFALFLFIIVAPFICVWIARRLDKDEWPI